MRFGSLFAGIGGFDLGLERAGMSCTWQVELDPQASAVSRHHWPDVERHADVREVSSATLSPVDLIVGGFPCQDLSVAGRRAGLAGERSGLFHQLCRVVSELAPRWILLENVPGLLSSHGGRDMGAVVGSLAELGYGWSYRCLDSRYFGLAQRRLRVFIVGRAGGVCPPEVLFESESMSRDLAASREAREDIAATLTRGVESGGRGGYAGRRREDDVNLVAGTLGSDHGNVRADQAWTDRLVAFPIAFNWQSGGDCRVNASETGTDALSVGQVPAVGFAFNQRREGRIQQVAGTVAEPSGTQLDGALTATGVRRLTPRECERLQGFPDDWTRYGLSEAGEVREMSDSARYRMLGNAVSVPVAEWIGRRMEAAS